MVRGVDALLEFLCLSSHWQGLAPVRVWMRVRYRERERERERESERERERDRVCARARGCVCVWEREREKERGRVCKSVYLCMRVRVYVRHELWYAPARVKKDTLDVS